MERMSEGGRFILICKIKNHHNLRENIWFSEVWIINLFQQPKSTYKLYKFPANYFNKTLIVIYKFDYICTLNFAGVVNPDSYREVDTPTMRAW